MFHKCVRTRTYILSLSLCSRRASSPAAAIFFAVSPRDPVDFLISQTHPDVRFGSKGDLRARLIQVCSTLDCVAKVENRTTLKISRKLIFRLLCCCVAIQRRYEGPWSILDKSIWSLTSPRSIRISSSKKFRSSPQKEFFNTIPLTADIGRLPQRVRKVPATDVAPGYLSSEPCKRSEASSSFKAKSSLASCSISSSGWTIVQ